MAINGWVHLTAGKYAGMDINPKATGVGIFMEGGRLYIELSFSRTILVEEEDEEQVFSKMTVLR